ncbi:MAG: DUF1840 family protein [Motiliproteus sp.]
MLITFKTQAYANITMFGDAAKTLLRLMQQNQNIPGAILADDVAEALLNLKNNLKGTLKGAPADASPDAADTQNEDDTDPPVSLDKRALPLLELLEAAAKAHVDITWDQGC